MKTISTQVDVEIDYDDFDEEELIECLESRGYSVSELSEYCPSSNIKSVVEKLYHLRRSGHDYEKLLDSLIYNAIGKIV